jgi:hypothetical protein
MLESLHPGGNDVDESRSLACHCSRDTCVRLTSESLRIAAVATGKMSEQCSKL